MATPDPEGKGQTAEEKAAAEAYAAHLKTLPDAIKAWNDEQIAAAQAKAEAESVVNTDSDSYGK